MIADELWKAAALVASPSGLRAEWVKLKRSSGEDVLGSKATSTVCGNGARRGVTGDFGDEEVVGEDMLLPVCLILGGAEEKDFASMLQCEQVDIYNDRACPNLLS